MSINNPDTLNEIKQKIEDTNWEEVFMRERKEKVLGQLRVANKNYCNWLESFLNNLPERYNDESWAYKTLKHNKDFTEQDIKNEKDLLHFYNFLHIVADAQRVKEYYDTRFFEEFEYVFKYNNIYYEWNILVGQGSITTIKKIEQPDFCIVNLDLYFQKEEEGNPMKKYKSYEEC